MVNESDFYDALDPDINYHECNENQIHSEYFTIDETRDIFENSNMNSLINYNIRSFASNLRYFSHIVEECKPKILVLTETWFTDLYQSDIKNYDSHHTIRSNRASGGVSVFIDCEYESKKINELSFVNDEIEVCTVQCILDQDQGDP